MPTIATDTTPDGARAVALLAGEKHLLEMVAQGSPLAEVLGALCRLVEEHGHGSLCSVTLVAPEGGRLLHCAGPSLPSSFNDGIHGRPLTVNSGPCARAACLKEQVIIEDITADLRWEASGWRALAMQHDLAACWSTPIRSREDRVLGVFAIYGRAPGRPTASQQAVIEQFTHLASIAIERHLADLALQRSEAQLARAQRLSRTGSFSYRVGPDEVVLSDETCRILGIEPGALPGGERLRDLVHPEDAPLFRQTLSSGGREVSFDGRVLTPAGVRHVQVIADVLRDEAGQPVEWVGAVRDVTEARLAEDALHRVRSELAHVARVTTLGELTASIAHEVSQPISGIVTNAGTCLRMLGAEPPDLEGARQATQRAIRDASRAADVIARLRALFRRGQAAKEVVDLNEATREVLALTRRELLKARVALRTDLAAELPPVVGDRVQLQQVVLNLIVNALEAMQGVAEDARALHVGTAPHEGAQVQLAVRDSGVGLDPQATDRIFEAFFTSKEGGMGMGLSISRSIVESHGGKLWAAANDGPGATFRLTIPQAGA